MSTTIQVGSLKELAKRLSRDMANRQRRCENATRKAAKRGVSVVKKNVPVAFGELRESVEAVAEDDGAKIEIDAPYAAAVEEGSRPHWVPLDALIRWVKLRGMQGLGTDRQVSRLPGSSTGRHAQRIADQIRGYSIEGGAATSVDAPEAIAKAIQLKIAEAGTRPQWYARSSVPAVREILAEEMDQAVQESDADS